MSEKRYYWFKFKKDFFSQAKVKKLQRLKDGDSCTIIYLKLCLYSLENNAILQYEGIEDSFIEELALKIDEPEELIEKTVEFLIKNKLAVELNENELELVEVKDNTGSESSSSVRMRKLRVKNEDTIKCDDKSEHLSKVKIESDTIEQQSDKKTSQCDATVKQSDTEKEIEIEIEIDINKELNKDKELNKELDIELDKKEENVSNTSNLSNLYLTLNDNSLYYFTFEQIEKFQFTFDKIDVKKQILKMEQWFSQNPNKRKDKEKIISFVDRWLAKNQIDYINSSFNNSNSSNYSNEKNNDDSSSNQTASYDRELFDYYLNQGIF